MMDEVGVSSSVVLSILMSQHQSFRADMYMLLVGSGSAVTPVYLHCITVLS